VELTFRRDHFRLALRVGGECNSTGNQFSLRSNLAGYRLKGKTGVLAPSVRLRLHVVHLRKGALKGVALHFLNMMRENFGLKLLSITASGGQNIRIRHHFRLEE